MMVTFVSQCEKKALNRTRRVLDAFANRIGDNTWQTIITDEGLIAVKTLLRKTATKNTAVSCHWIRSRSRSELVWIVGNRRRFNAEGVVAVNFTKKNLLNTHTEHNWQYLPVIKALVAIAALLHDWGKATALFQAKLKNKAQIGDPLRHEWISCLLLNALVQLAGNTDLQWLELLQSGKLDTKAMENCVLQNSKNPLFDLPPIAQLVGWLILTHHRLPYLTEKNARDPLYNINKSDLNSMMKSICANWGYQNQNTDDKRLKACFEFPDGLLTQSSHWLKQLQKWSAKLIKLEIQTQSLIDSGTYRVALHHARLCLMLGDHYYSSCDADTGWKSTVGLYANTDKTGLKQKLDEHLVKVSEQALKICHNLSRFVTDMDYAYDIKNLKKKSPAKFGWQDKAVECINSFKTQHAQYQEKGYGWFIVNMASTGCGKTIANAKIMRCLSHDGESLRFILALGLRTLTLQTGDEYRNRIGLNKTELAVLIGSTVIKELHDQVKLEKDDTPSFEELGSESLEMLLAEELDDSEYLNDSNAPSADFMDVLFPKHNHKLAEKHKSFLYKPVLVCTIDHIIAATETLRGGKYMLPYLRLLSSDLVIDEVDDFDGNDLIAIGRLIHLAGMLGRKVMISSATIPLDLAEGFFNAYQEGWALHSHFQQTHNWIASVWIDEFGTRIHSFDKANSSLRCKQYQGCHKEYIEKRVKNLQKQIVKRKAYIVDCTDLFLEKSDQHSKQEQYFELIRQVSCKLHQHHHIIDENTGKNVSFGVIRMANIPPCVALMQYLLNAEWGEEFAPKIMVYHSRQVLLLRHEQEKHLDEILKRSDNNPNHTLNHPQIRAHLNNINAANVLFILVASPVEEVGRDHDFDWAIIEPSSFRSIIQLAGRVYRHRELEHDIDFANIAIMQYNLKALRQDNKPVFYRPGYENLKSLRLNTHKLNELVDELSLNNAVNAIPRIKKPEPLNPKSKLSDLEHQAIHVTLTNYTQTGPQGMQAWLTEYWWLTALPMQMNRFRESHPEKTIYLIWNDAKLIFHEKNERGDFIPIQSLLDIKKAPDMDEKMQTRLWMDRSYVALLVQQIKTVNDTADFDIELAMNKKSKHYGEINIQHDDNKKWFYSDQLGMFLNMF